MSSSVMETNYTSRNQAALKRLVARHPPLSQDPAVMRLLLKGSDLEDEDILGVSQELLLRPNLTVPAAGCFRHLLPQMVSNLVDVMRQRYAQRMMPDSNGESGETVSSTNYWNLTVHEYVIMAFSRILELAPYLLSTLLQYFSFAPPPFERLLCGGFSTAQQMEMSVPCLLDIVRASYRFIQLEPTTFQDLWDWSPFLDLLLWVDADSEDAALSQNTSDVRWCAVQILSLVTRMSDEATRAFSFKMSCLTEEMAFACLIRWEEFCQEIAIEKAGWYVEPNHSPSEHLSFPDFDLASSNAKSHSIIDSQRQVKWKRRASNQISHVEICGIELPVREDMISTDSSLPSFGKSLVLTSTVRRNLKALVLALSQRQPVLLEGPLGAGKTFLIQELGQLTGNSDVIFIHLDDQMDSKTLLGTYVCSEVPGEFRWQPGALTQAVLRGLWIVFEDIDRAPFEILSALVPLLEDRKLYIPGRAETISAAENFQLFATVTKTNFGSPSCSPGWEILNNLWRKVVIDAPSEDELAVIVEKSFPLLTPLVSKLIGTLKMVNDIASQLVSPIDTISDAAIYVGRQFSMRDLLKWCKRIMASNEVGGPMLSTSVRGVIYREAVDCFAGCIPSAESRRLVMIAIARLWDVDEERVDFLETLNKPLLQILPNVVQVGRASLPIQSLKEKNAVVRLFANTGHAMWNLERIAVCSLQQEPVLLVGETGTGKTTLVQHLARQLSMPLTVVNLSQQSDSADLLGGFKPIEAQSICLSLLEIFMDLFCRTFPLQRNSEFLVRVQQFAEKKKWNQLLKAFRTAVTKVASLLGSASFKLNNLSRKTDFDTVVKSKVETRTKRKRPLSKELTDEWHYFSLELGKCQRQVEAAKSAFAFSFIEGALVRAFRHGHWILLDEVNLAPIETLQRLTGILDGEQGSLSLTERGDIENVPRHPNFRVFACMNPATDVGKHDLPFSLKNRFTEFYIDELTNTEDLHSFVYRYLEGLMPCPPVVDIVDFYRQAQQEAETRLFDGANQKPRYSLRSLARALEYTRAAMPVYGFLRALYDGICMTFLTLLDRPSSAIMENLISSWLLKQPGLVSKANSSPVKVPTQPSSNHVLFEQFWVESGGFKASKSSLEFSKRYVLTKSIREHLKNVAKAVFIRRYPVLLQGPTSSGKTSLIEYLATITGHRFVRINNHEHTDLQEYLGTYVTDSSGKLVFQEGILVEAVRNGYWIVLDELNLAPSEVLEALNRLLDDNRELFVPELQTTVKPHPHFMLFATQNPPGMYGGRKILSRAFRNRFLELHIDDIPEDEICSILEKRCEIPGSYAQKMVAVMRDLQRNRQSSQVFAGKHGFITPRDLFRWADRHRRAGISYEDLAKDGYILLAERLREASEKAVVLEALEKNLHVKINIETLYEEMSTTSQMQELKKHLTSTSALAAFGKIVWTKSMKRLFSLVEHCYKHNEPMLLVGETGCGKTTVCQLLAMVHEQHLHILNCHQHTETADFLGGFRPVRERESISLQFELAVNKINASKLFCEFHQIQPPSGIENIDTTLAMLEKVFAAAKDQISGLASGQLEIKSELQREIFNLEVIEQELLRLHKDWQSLFIWQDGPLVEAMRRGDLFLVDEISLADDSVLERLNSVLEPKRLLVLAEKGGSNVEELVAHPKFLVMATMNPGGDFGKKELSPALRNRFTEIWVPPITDLEDLKSIIVARFSRPCLTCLVDPLLSFWEWFQQRQIGRCLTVRDLLSWIIFINTVEKSTGMYAALIHGAYLILLDGIGLGTGLSNEASKEFKNACLEFLLLQIPQDKKTEGSDFKEYNMVSTKLLSLSNNMVGIHPFYIPKGPNDSRRSNFELMAPTTGINTFRILRAMQLRKPVLIEGSPGVGKTSLIVALANVSGHSLVRINLSEQTDIMDLFGSDLPVEGLKGAEFCWSDGIFLQALKAGSWVLLDELNLASQSVLEGLNACLDHRGEVFIPELGRSFKCPPTFRVFACQNPSHQGCGRKSLPKSFLNRFTKVYVDTLSEDDFLFIANLLHPSISKHFLQNLIRFNTRLYGDTMVAHIYGHSGAPWEFNLRDILRACCLIEENKGKHYSIAQGTGSFLEVVYLQRMRSAEDRCNVLKLYQEIFGSPAAIEAFPRISLSSQCLTVGKVCLKRASGSQSWDSKDRLQFLPGQVKCLESIMHCVQQGWMSILVGPPACGKTSLVRLLAELTGNPLQEFTLSSGTDTTELLGCFEQCDLFRSWQDLVKKVYCVLQMTCSCCLTSPGGRLSAYKIVTLVKTLLASWSTLKKCLNVRHNGTAWALTCCQQNLETNVLDPLAVELLSKVLKQLEQMVHICELPAFWISSDVEALITELGGLNKKLSKTGNSGQFEWVDGGLLKAIERGEWVLLENANLCNPTVLDRLNPLLEPNGTILINERGLVNGEAMVVQAHPNFRLFLTVDPSQGEVSRAMRNRGVEIYVMQPHWLITDANAGAPLPSQLDEIRKGAQDATRFLVSTGLPSATLVEAMCRAHTEMKVLSETSWMGHRVSLRELSQWVQLVQQLVDRGADLFWSMCCSWEQIYVRSLDNTEARDASIGIFKSHFVNLNIAAMDTNMATLHLPGGWPRPLNVTKVGRMSIETIVMRDCMYLELLIVEQVAFHVLSGFCQYAKTKSGTESTFSWLLRKKDIASMFPAHLFSDFLHPSSFDVVSTNKPQSDRVSLDRMVMCAGLWMMEQANMYDRKIRLLWLKNFSAKVGFYCYSLKLLFNVVERELEHPASKQLHCALENLKLLRDASIDMECQGSHQSNSMNDLDNWRQEGFLTTKLCALRRTLVQWQVEDEALAQAENAGFSRTEPSVLQSFRYHAHQSSGKISLMALNDLVVGLYPVLQSVRELEEEVLISNCPVWDAQANKLFLRLLEWHKAFWEVVYKTSFESHSLLFCWSKMKQCVNLLIQGLIETKPTSIKVVDKVLLISQSMDAALAQDTGFLKSYLWKYAGHPHMPRSKELFEKQQLILKFCHALWPGSAQGDQEALGVGSSENFRRLTMEGVSMAMWLIQGSLEAKGSTLKENFVASDTLRESDEIYKRLTERFDAEKLCMKKLQKHRWSPFFSILKSSIGLSSVKNCKCSPPHFLEHVYHPELLFQSTSQSCLLTVLPWLDTLSLHREAVALTEIAHIAAQYVGNEGSCSGFTQQLLGPGKQLLEVMNFSLKFSTRSPLDFVPHQQLAWIMDASIGGGEIQMGTFITKIQNIVHQIWFNWHSAAWTKLSQCHLDQLSHVWNATAGPPRLFQASESTMLSNLILQAVSVKDHYAKVVQLRLVAELLWSGARRRSHDSFQSDFQRASAVLQQIIFAHARSFKEEDMGEIKSLLTALHLRALHQQGCQVEEGGAMERLKVLLKNSNHPSFVNLNDSFIFPCIKLIYQDLCSTVNAADFLFMHGQIWLLLGSLRLRLTLPSNANDPASKYTFEHAILSEKLSESRLELKVRQDSDLVVRGGVNITDNSELVSTIKELEHDLVNATSKLVYRPRPSGVLAFHKEVNGFIESVTSSYNLSGWIDAFGKTVGKADMARTIQEVTHWQENAMHFICRLSADYSDYQDLAQPVQLSVFELKFGLSLMMSAWLRKDFLMQGGSKIRGNNLFELLCKLVEFPSSANVENFHCGETHLSYRRIQNDGILSALSISELLKMASIESFSGLVGTDVAEGKDKEGLVTRVRVMIFRCALAHARKDILHARLICGTSLEIIIQLLKSVAAFWMEMREYLDARKEAGTELIQFKHRTHAMDAELEQDEAAFRSMFPEFLSSFEVNSESSEIIDENKTCDEESTTNDLEELKVLERAWVSIEDLLSQDVTSIHSQIFALYGMLQWNSNCCLVSDEQRLDAFVVGYDAGKLILEAAGHSMPAKVNDKFNPAHLLRLCVEHENLASSAGGGEPKMFSFNIYKDSIAPETALMLDPLANLRDRIDGLLSEWPEQPVLLQLLQIIESLFSMNLHAPLMKALIGVEHLLAKAQLWEENAPKHLSLTGELNGLACLVSRWRKLELECWPVLLENVERQYEIGAEKLWFSLHEVLHRSIGVDLDSELEATIASLEEFMQTATLGEFKRRLDILLGFYGQFSIQTHFIAPPCGLSSAVVERLSRVLYNIFKYYSQFLPLVQDSIISGKTPIESELKEFTRLCKWDDCSYYSLASSVDKMHRKVHKLVCKYKEVLRRSVIEILNQVEQHMGTSNLDDKDAFLLHKSIEATDIVNQNCERGDKGGVKDISSTDCWKLFLEAKVKNLIDLASKNIDLVGTYYKKLPSLLPRLCSLLGSSVFSEMACQVRQKGTELLDDLGKTVVVRAAELREGEKRRIVKKKALVDLLKGLRHIGLSHHRTAIPKEERDTKAWFQQPPSEVCNLFDFWIQRTLNADEKDVASAFGVAQIQDCSLKWKRASDYYFKNMALVQHLRQSSLNFNKDLSLREVAVSSAYIEHLLYLQRRQRSIAYEFALKLAAVQNITSQLGCFGKVYGNTKLAEQGYLRKWMWHQKDLLDSLCSTSSEVSLFYKMVKRVHVCPFDSAQSEAGKVKDALDKITVMLNSCKNNLDNHLVPGIYLFSISDIESTWPILITPHMEKTLMDNFFILVDAKAALDNINLQADDFTTEVAPGLSSLHELFCKGLEMFVGFKEEGISNFSNVTSCHKDKREFMEQYDRVISEILLSVQVLSRLESISDIMTSSNGSGSDVTSFVFSTEKAETIQTWALAIEDQMSALRLERMYNAVLDAIAVGVKSFDSEVGNDSIQIGIQLQCMRELLDFILAAGMLILCDYVSLNKTVAKLCYILSNIFSSLFHDGFCAAKEDKEENQASELKDSSGTGMGEGEGKTDVSNQIEDEEQLLGSSEKEKKDHGSEGNPESIDKGVEMEQDFEGEMVDISQNESDEAGEESDDDQQLESKMGETGENEEIVDEKLWNNEDDDTLGQGGKEKYETGASVQDGGSDLEFRAKENEIEDGSGQDPEKEGLQTQDSASPEASSPGGDKVEDNQETTPLDKSDAYEDPSGIKPSTEEEIDVPENMDLDREDDQEENSREDSKELKETMAGEDDGNSFSSPEVSGQEGEPLDTNLGENEENTVEKQNENSTSEKQTEPSDQNLSLEHSRHVPDLTEEQRTGEVQEMKDTDTVDPSSNLSMENFKAAIVSSSMATDPVSFTEQAQGQQSNTSQVMRNDEEMVSSTAKAFEGETLASELADHNHDLQTMERLDANPYRSLGDALKDWKERVRVSDKPPSDMKATESLVEDLHDTGDEYQFVTENEKSSAQTLGAATVEQLDQSREANGSEAKKDVLNDQEETIMSFPEMQKEEEPDPKIIEQRHLQKTIKGRVTENSEAASSEDLIHEDGSADVEMIDTLDQLQDSARALESAVSIKINHTRDLISAPKAASSGQPWSEEEIRRTRRELELNLNEGTHSFEKARSMWTKYEQLTTRLSQELTEQLRLIMEPTLATRLEGDYRTGKRINMKKVIPYIASQFRKDKIWLRRTKPSKRQYQVVLAIDDSRSMSESHCGHMALEALITICRAMSTLDVGQMAVASFGERGNVNLLHDFDQPFSTEAGIRMVSQFSFKQENTIADEPMVDLLHYLTRMLDIVALNASIPSGRNNLQQLVLIIADGRFHEKETLRRCIREALSRRQLLAFIILDNPQESIMDVQSVSFTGGAPTFSNYIDTFPFPYYILLKDIEALPRTLVDLLRQWFELMQRNFLH